MPRPHNPDISIPWKCHIPAPLAGAVEFLLSDPSNAHRIRYGSRNRLIVKLLEEWHENYKSGRPCIDPFGKD